MQKVSEKQILYKKYFDKKTRAKKLDVVCGQKVRIKLPGCIRKGRSVFSEPKVVKRVGRSYVELQDGSRWNRIRSVKVSDMCEDNGWEGKDAGAIVSKILESGIREKESSSDME